MKCIGVLQDAVVHVMSRNQGTCMPPLKPRKTSPAQSSQAGNLKGYVLPLHDPNVPLKIIASPLACSRASYLSVNLLCTDFAFV